jgi:hypothetical protein
VNFCLITTNFAPCQTDTSASNIRCKPQVPRPHFRLSRVESSCSAGYRQATLPSRNAISVEECQFRLRQGRIFLCSGANRLKTFVKVSGSSRRNFRLPFGGLIEGTHQTSKIFIWGVQPPRGRKSGVQKFLGPPFFSAAAKVTITKLHLFIEDLETHKIFQYGRANLHNF